MGESRSGNNPPKGEEVKRKIDMSKTFDPEKYNGLLSGESYLREINQVPLNAASVASLLITTQAVVAEKPKKEQAGPPMPPEY